ncbi:MAG: hypothetical protein R8G60_13130 [Roseovarius pacificus]|nr:hypothetical protein [Roseovarius pacificus]
MDLSHVFYSIMKGLNMNNKYINIFFFVANLRGYTKNEAEAANVYHDRKHRLAHPPGSWDKAGRFYPDEDSKHLDGTRPPSSHGHFLTTLLRGTPSMLARSSEPVTL